MVFQFGRIDAWGLSERPVLCHCCPCNARYANMCCADAHFRWWDVVFAFGRIRFFSTTFHSVPATNSINWIELYYTRRAYVYICYRCTLLVSARIMYSLIAIFGYEPIFCAAASSPLTSSIFMFCFCWFFGIRLCWHTKYPPLTYTHSTHISLSLSLANYGRWLTAHCLKFVTDEKIAWWSRLVGPSGLCIQYTQSRVCVKCEIECTLYGETVHSAHSSASASQPISYIEN